MTTAARDLADALVADAVAIADAAASLSDGGIDDTSPTPAPPARTSPREDAVLHVQHLAAALRVGEPRVFDDHVLTAAGILESDGGRRQELEDRLRVLIEVIGQRYGPTAHSAAGSLLHGSLARLASSGPGSAPRPDEGGPSAALAGQMLDTLLGGDPRTAVAMLLDEAAADGDVSGLYREVLTPCLREVGRLWQLGRVSVAQEHLVTATVELVMAQLYPRRVATPRREHEVVISAVDGELHAVGARMVADHFELAGWGTYFLGADVPTADLVRLVEAVGPDVVAVSASMPSNVPEVAAVVRAVRAAGSTVVMVGGRAFNLVPGLWQVVGADGTASDAMAAVRRATELVAVRTTTAHDPALERGASGADEHLDTSLSDRTDHEPARGHERPETVDDRQDEILAAVAHDLRTPLGLVVGFVDVLRRKLTPKLDDEDRLLLDRIEAQSGRMLQMAEDLVDATVISRGVLSLEFSQVELRPLLEEVVDLHVPAAERKGISIELEVPDGLPPARVDRNRLTQVLDNLLSNAIKFSPVDRGTTITATGRVEDDGLVVEIADQGVGIDPELQARLFQPFVRAGASGTDGEPSTGLGLAISRSLVRAHGGDITVHSEIDVGTTVTVRLPLDATGERPADLRAVRSDDGS